MIHDSRRRRLSVAAGEPSRKWVMESGSKGRFLRSKARSGEIVVRGVVYRGSEDMVARCCSWVGDG